MVLMSINITTVGFLRDLNSSFFDCLIVTTITRSFSILDVDFTVDELKDIVTHGMSMGVGGFITYYDCIKQFDDNEDDIETYLCDWVNDNIDSETNYIQWVIENAKNDGHDPMSINALKTRLVWAYVELNAYEILSQNDIEF
jgi:hypothetical protein